MKPGSQLLYKMVSNTHREVYGRLDSLRQECRQDSLTNLVDNGYVLSESLKLLDDLSKEIKRTLRAINNTIVTKQLNESLEEGDPELFNVADLDKARANLNAQGKTAKKKIGTIKTEYVTATPKIGHEVSFPAKSYKDPETFKKVMEDLGLTSEQYYVYNDAGDAVDLVRPSWEGYCVYASRKLNAGEPLPVDPKHIYTVMDVSYRGRKDI